MPNGLAKPRWRRLTSTLIKQRNARASGFWGFVRVGKRANALHAGLAAIGIFPYELVAVAVRLTALGPSQIHKSSKHCFPNHRCRGARAIFALTNREHDLAFRVIRIQPAGGVGAVIVNNTAGGYHRAAAALFNTFDMFNIAARHSAPQPANVVGTIGQGLGALSQYRQGKMRITASRRIAFGNIGGVFARAVKYTLRAIVERAAVTSQRCRIGGKRRAFRQKGQPERADKDKSRKTARLRKFFSWASLTDLFGVREAVAGNTGAALTCGAFHRIFK